MVWRLYLYVHSHAGNVSIRNVFNFKVAIAANSKMTTIWFLNIYINTFLALNQLLRNYLQTFYLSSEMLQFYGNWYKIQNGHQTQNGGNF